MSYVNMLETDPLEEFAKLLSSVDKSKAAELMKLAANLDHAAVIENGYLPAIKTIVDSKDKNTLDLSSVMCFSALTKIDSAKKDGLILTLKDTFIKESDGIEASKLLSILTSLFNLLDPSSNARYSLFLDVAKVAEKADLVGWMVNDDILKRVSDFKSDWKLSPVQHSKFILTLIKLSKSVGKKSALDNLLVAYLSSLDHILGTSEAKDNEELVKGAADYTLLAVESAIKNPFESARRMRQLSKFKAVQGLKTSEPRMWELLDAYVNEDIKKYSAYADGKGNLEYMKEHSINHDANIKNFRVFAACRLEHKRYTYKELQQALNLASEEEVEEAVIAMVLSKKVGAKIDQETGHIHIRHTTQREFRDNEWPALAVQLNKWKDGVKSVLNSLHKARQM